MNIIELAKRNEMPNPTEHEYLYDPIFNAIWQVTKTWDVNAPEYYEGYCGFNGSHVKIIMDAVKAQLLQQGEAVATLALKNTELNKHISVLEDLLSSAYNIANRNGENTHWERFAGQLHIHGINPVTPKTFKILPSDENYTTPPSTQQKLDKAREALDALLDDMGEEGLTVCQAAKDFAQQALKETE